MDVKINGVTYAPKCDIKKPDDSAITEVLQTITETLYHMEKHKAYARMWNILHALSPDLFRLAQEDASAAYDAMHDKD